MKMLLYVLIVISLVSRVENLNKFDLFLLNKITINDREQVTTYSTLT